MPDLGGRALAHGGALAEHAERRLLVGQAVDHRVPVVDRLVVVGVQQEVDGVAAQHVVEAGDREHDAGVDPVGAHDDGAVELAEGVALLQVVEAHEGADLGAEAEQLAAGADLERAHVVGDDAHLADALLAGHAQRLERLALARRGVADEEHRGAGAVVEGQPRVGAVERHDAAVHGGDVVQREHHLLEVAEVAEAVLERDRRHQQAAAAVVVEHGGQVAEAGERRRRDAVEVHGVGAGGDLLVRGDLEQVGEAQAEAHEAAVEVDEHRHPPHQRRVAEPLLALELEPVERVVLRPP